MNPQRKPALAFIFVTLLLDVTGFGIIIPVFPKLISELTHGTLSQASQYTGWLMFAFAIMQFVFSPIMGNLSDKYGRRPVLLFSLFGFGIDYLFLAFAPTIGLLFVGRIIAGITGASMTTANAYIADISPPEKRAQNFGLVGAAFGLGFIVGPAIGGLLGSFGSRVPFLVAAVLTLMNWLYGYFILPESLPKENRRSFDWKRANPAGSLVHLKKYPVITGLIGALVLVYIAGHAVQSNWSFYTMEKFKWGPDTIGYSLAVVGILIAIVQGWLVRVITPKIGTKNSVYYGLALNTIGFVLFAFATADWMMFVFLIPFCLGGLCGPALQSILSNQVPENEQGELQGALTSLMSVTMIIGPLLMNNIFAYFTGADRPFYFPGAALVMGAILSLISLALTMRSLSTYVHIHDGEAPKAK
ncbi:MAG: TCR/Tet family MFS transporter [bacterium]